MSLKYQFSLRAKADLQAILDYSHRTWGPTQTLSYIDELQQRVIWLADNPGVGRVRDELATGLRSYPQGRHMIHYLVTERELLILRVRHQSADPLTDMELLP